MSSFRAMIQFKQKMIPNSHLLRWSEWFFQWSFDVKHIKGKDNAAIDFFSRPPQPSYIVSQISQVSCAPVQIYQPPLVLPYIFPITQITPEMDPDIPIVDAVNLLPEEIQEQISANTLQSRDQEQMQKFLEATLCKYGTVFQGLRLHPRYPHYTLFHLHYPSRRPKLALCFLRYLTRRYTIAFFLDAPKLYYYLIFLVDDPNLQNLLSASNYWCF